MWLLSFHTCYPQHRTSICKARSDMVQLLLVATSPILSLESAPERHSRQVLFRLHPGPVAFASWCSDFRWYNAETIFVITWSNWWKQLQNPDRTIPSLPQSRQIERRRVEVATEPLLLHIGTSGWDGIRCRPGPQYVGCSRSSNNNNNNNGSSWCAFKSPSVKFDQV